MVEGAVNFDFSSIKFIVDLCQPALLRVLENKGDGPWVIRVRDTRESSLDKTVDICVYSAFLV